MLHSFYDDTRHSRTASRTHVAATCSKRSRVHLQSLQKAMTLMHDPSKGVGGGSWAPHALICPAFVAGYVWHLSSVINVEQRVEQLPQLGLAASLITGSYTNAIHSMINALLTCMYHACIMRHAACGMPLGLSSSLRCRRVVIATSSRRHSLHFPLC